MSNRHEHTLKLKDADVELIAWYHKGESYEYPNIYYETGFLWPQLDSPNGFVDLEEEQNFRSFLLKLEEYQEEYYLVHLADAGHYEDAEFEANFRRQFIQSVFEETEDMLPRWLHPLAWDLEDVFAPAPLQDTNSPDNSDGESDSENDDERTYEGEMEVVHIQHEPVGPRIPTNTLVHTVGHPTTGGECGVCFAGATPDEGLVQANCCDHLFHFSCLDGWLNSGAENSNLCPQCRGVISANRRETREVVDQDQVNAWGGNAR